MLTHGLHAATRLAEPVGVYKAWVGEEKKGGMEAVCQGVIERERVKII